ncbi:MAG: preprotein translocase subunit SecA [Vampirovibrionales bacterium]|nr:preprotein translocase subunit SecA [Vampirovibrionales bacterium]
MFDLVYKVIGHPNDRKIKKLLPTVDLINDLSPRYEAMSDEELRAETRRFQTMLKNRAISDNPARDRELEEAVLDEILPEAFATCREASKRALGMRHFDVQLLGGMVLHKCGISEMRTGEGKTLVATLPCYLNALTGRGVHVVTVNDYLAKRDAEWMGRLYGFLGLSTGVVLSSDRRGPAAKRQAYAADITYGTNNEFGFDYLRDNMATRKEALAQRPFYYAIVDEVDSILIDEARTPLIISGRVAQSAELYNAMAQLVQHLNEEDDYTLDEKARNVILTEEGIDRAQALLQIDDLFDPETNYAHHVLQALKAKTLYKRDIDYVVKDDQVVIVDEFTGRLMEGRRWSDGLHQSVEAKEGVAIQDETQTLASITFQNLFRLYPKLCGMTGTAMTEEAEFGKIYNLAVTTIPTNKKDIRDDAPDLVYKSERIKFFRVVEDIVEQHLKGRPVLVGTTSIEKSERISQLLTHPETLHEHLNQKAARFSQGILKEGKLKSFTPELQAQVSQAFNQPANTPAQQWRAMAQAVTAQNPDLAAMLDDLALTAQAVQTIAHGVPHHVLNAKHHEQEARIIAQAGRKNAVTIATNMAGRGTDILLGGNAEFMAREQYLEQLGLAETPEALPTNYLDDPQYKALLEEKLEITRQAKQDVLAAGGLYIIGTERHESRRIDNQLRGRAGRQGDPGTSRFYLSLEDSLMRLFGGQKISGLMDMLNVDETLPITAGLVSKAIENAQRKVEAYHFDIRKNVIRYDDVLTEQRQLIYEQRRQVLMGESMRASMLHMLNAEMARLVYNHVDPKTILPAASDMRAALESQAQATQDAQAATLTLPDERSDTEPVKDMVDMANALIPQLQGFTYETVAGKSAEDVVALLQAGAINAYEQLEATLGEVAGNLKAQHGVVLSGIDAANEDELNVALEGKSDAEKQELMHPLRRVERDILMAIVDAKWIDYLHNLDALRDGIGLRAYGQKDPLIEYKREAYAMFQQLTYDIQRETVSLLFRTRIEIQIPEEAMAAVASAQAQNRSELNQSGLNEQPMAENATQLAEQS